MYFLKHTKTAKIHVQIEMLTVWLHKKNVQTSNEKNSLKNK